MSHNSLVDQKRRQLPGRRGFVLGFAGVFAVGVLVLLLRGGAAHELANPGDAAQVAHGRQIYMTHCASCHGARLEGQPRWRERGPSGARPAPPHDASGHTWHHPDQQLFEIIKHGGQLYAAGQLNNMPAFGPLLSEQEIWAVLAFIKSTWPPDVRQQHQRLNQQ